jgi:hypothetical protein
VTLHEWLAYPILILFIVIASVGCDEIPKAVDLQMSAEEAGDLTAVMEGCSQGVQDGYLFCRVYQMTDPVGSITIHLPKVDCDRDSCFDFLFLDKDGNDAFQVGVPKGQKSFSVSIAQILGSTEPYLSSQTGTYRVLVRGLWKDKDGYQHMMRTEGVFSLLVLPTGYTRLACDDPDTGWAHSVRPGCEVEYSTAFRTRACGDGCKGP